MYIRQTSVWNWNDKGQIILQKTCYILCPFNFFLLLTFFDIITFQLHDTLFALPNLGDHCRWCKLVLGAILEEYDCFQWKLDLWIHSHGFSLQPKRRCFVYSYYALPLFFCVHLVLATLARFWNHIWLSIFRFSQAKASCYIKKLILKNIFLACVKKCIFFPCD